MTERYEDPRSVLVDEIVSLIEQPWEELGDHLHSPNVSKLVEAAYAPNPLLPGVPGDSWSFHDMFSAGNHEDDVAYDDEKLIASMGVAWMLESMTQQLQTVYGNPDDDTNIANGSYALRPLRQGQQKLLRVTIGQNAELQEDQVSQDIAPTLLPLWLAHVAAYSISEQVDGDADRVRRSLQFSAQHIMKERASVFKFSPDASPLAEVSGRALNMLAALYWRGEDKDFYTRFIKHYYDVLLTENPSMAPSGNLIEPEELGVLLGKHSEMIAEEVKKFGIPSTVVAGVMDGILNLSTMPSRRSLKPLRSATKRQKADGNFREKLDNKTTTYSHNLQAKRTPVMIESQGVLVAREMVQLMANGEFDWTALHELVERLNSKPLADRAAARIVLEKEVEWEIAPPAIGQGKPRAAGERHTTGDGSRKVDESRREKLDAYVRMWGAGDVWRSRIPNLKDEDQYYVAVLPQMVGGILLEHGIGDNKLEDDHAVFVWRAERGIGRFGQVQWNWETVFSQYKDTMKRMGARKMLHTDTLDERVLEYLTRPEDKLQDKKYYI